MSCLGCSSRPKTKYFFPHRTLFQFICPHSPSPTKLGTGQAAVLGRLSCSMCLWLPPPLWCRGGGTHSLAGEGVGESQFGRWDRHSGTPRFKGSAATRALLQRENFSVFFQLILAPVVHWLALVLRLLCPALYFFIMERRARKESKP